MVYFVTDDGTNSPPTQPSSGSEHFVVSAITAKEGELTGSSRMGGARRRIVNTWTFPMHSLDFSLIDVTKSVGDEQARRIRAAVWNAGD